MRTRVRLLCTILTMMVVISSCTLAQVRSYNRGLAANGDVTIPLSVASDFQATKKVTTTTAAPAKVVVKKVATETPAATTTADTGGRNRDVFAAYALADQRRAVMKAADKKAEVKKVLDYLAAEAAKADPYGYNRVTQYVSDAGLKRLRDCESTDRYYITNPSGKYRGAYQFDFPTWDGVASRWFPHLVGVDPIVAPPEAQDAMVRALWSERGRYPWPECGLRV